jgi:hypothetical protein
MFVNSIDWSESEIHPTTNKFMFYGIFITLKCIAQKTVQSLSGSIRYSSGRAVPRRLLGGFPPRRSGFESAPGLVGFVVNKAALLHVSCEYLGFPCYSSYRLLHTHHHPSCMIQGWYNRPTSGLNNCGLGSAAPKERKTMSSPIRLILQSVKWGEACRVAPYRIERTSGLGLLCNVVSSHQQATF